MALSTQKLVRIINDYMVIREEQCARYSCDTGGGEHSAGKAGGSSKIAFILNINFIPVEYISTCSVCCHCPCSSCATGHLILCSSLGQRQEDRQINKTAAKHEHRGRLQVLTMSSA